MDYDNMSDYELKKLLIKTMKEHESIHYVLGWLEMSYCSPFPIKTERELAIIKLKAYGV
jgi:hypothetical protein